MTDTIVCHCGQGERVMVRFGTGSELTECCTCTIAKYEALHGPFKWPVVEGEI